MTFPPRLMVSIDQRLFPEKQTCRRNVFRQQYIFTASTGLINSEVFTLQMYNKKMEI